MPALPLFTFGHGTADEATFASRLMAAGVHRVVDVRRFPGSRRWPWFSAEAMARWLPEHGLIYAPAPELGGRRKPHPDSPNVGLRDPGFRGYADYMATEPFREAFVALLREADETPTAMVCSETLWWRCHRRLIADAAVLLDGREIVHLVGATRQPHKPTPGVRRLDGELRYDAGPG